MTQDLLEVFQSMDFSEDEGIALNDRVLIIDGMNTFIRSFAAIPTMDENGNHIGGVTGFLKSVGYVTRKFKPFSSSSSFYSYSNHFTLMFNIIFNLEGICS